MAAAGGTHTRLVQTAKIVLPLAALALFATLFLIAKQIDPDAAVIGTNAEDIAREARIGTPEFSGVTSDGTVVSMTAEAARPGQDDPGRITIEEIEAAFDIPDGSRIEATAGLAAVDGTARRIELSGGSLITTSTGYRIESQGLSADLAQTNIVSDGAVTADGPPGRIEAGSLALHQAEGDPSTYVLVFNGGVRLIYQPDH